MIFSHLFIVTVTLSFFLTATVVEAQQSHDSAACESCHLSSPTSGGIAIYTDDIDKLCSACHQVSVVNSHPSGFTPGRELPKIFWLDLGGKLNCATCHDFHPDESTSSPFLLRSSGHNTDFCKHCHAAAQPPPPGRPEMIMEHLGTSFVAHRKAYTQPKGNSSVLDGITTNCLDCHNGASGPIPEYCLPDDKAPCNSHMIGADYAIAAAVNGELRSLSDLSPLVSLYEGKVGCASCHSIYSSEDMLLVFNNKGSAICRECHLK